MTLDIELVAVSLTAEQEFEDLSQVIDTLKEVRLTDALSDFENQLSDISDGDSLVIFNEAPEDSDGQNNVIFGPASGLPPEDQEHSDPSVLQIQSNFGTNFELMKDTFEELLNPEDGALDQLTVLDISFSFKVDDEFQSIEALQPLFEATAHDVTGIQIKQNGFTYIFQEVKDGVVVNVNSEETFVTEEHTFLDTQLEQARPFVKEIIQGDD